MLAKNLLDAGAKRLNYNDLLSPVCALQSETQHHDITHSEDKENVRTTHETQPESERHNWTIHI